MANYGLLDRVLHRLALQITPIAELSFDLDQNASKADVLATKAGQHVFVSGLARAGTTILLRRLYATGDFCSLTYRNMPFVLAPKLWGRYAARSAGDTALQERAHGDRILVNAESPESLDEVFWRIFDGSSYIGPSNLTPHTPDAELATKFASYVGAILKADPVGRTRYLSKNNNNILRLKTLAETFPEARILVPFRAPVAHARSLMKQHSNFLAQQQDNDFVRAYMTWLGHHEFGGNHRPFRFDAAGADRLAARDPDEITYWLELWCQVYAWLENTAPPGVIFVCYEDLCSNPTVWQGLARLCNVTKGSTEQEPFAISTTQAEADVDADLLTQSNALYNRLTLRAADAIATANAGRH